MIRKVNLELLMKFRNIVIGKLFYSRYNWFARALSCLSALKIQYQKIEFLDEQYSWVVKKISSCEFVEIMPPRFHGSGSYREGIKVVSPDVVLYQLNNVEVRGDSSNFLKKDCAVIERVQSVPIEKCRYNTGSVIAHDGVTAIVCLSKPVKKIEKAIFLAGNGSWNYYHWLIEILPKIKYFMEAGVLCNECTIIVPWQVNIHKSFLDTLNMALGEIKCNVIVTPKSAKLLVSSLYIVNTASNVVFNPARIAIEPGFFVFRTDAIDYLRKLFISCVDTSVEYSSNKYYKRIFLARRVGAIRSYNQNEVINVFRDNGFMVIYPEELNLEEQIAAFQHADFIAGPSGAAWANIIFAKRGTKAISWLSESVAGFSVFSSLANYVGVDMKFVLAKSKDNIEVHSNYIVDCNNITSLIKDMSLAEGNL